MKIDLKELGKRIKLTRKGQDLTQEMLAEKAGVSQHYLFGDGQRIFDVDTPAHHNNQLMEIAAELNPSHRDHVLEILEVMVPYIKN